jgi:hypothetical protein
MDYKYEIFKIVKEYFHRPCSYILAQMYSDMDKIIEEIKAEALQEAVDEGLYVHIDDVKELES